MIGESNRLLVFVQRRFQTVPGVPWVRIDARGAIHQLELGESRCMLVVYGNDTL